ncbi:MAG TPA: DNA polymerase III subunit alpha [Candidatus Kapabacteria bacterium]|nr:DNA polymerase III subunit alpha [Candidatus Kapabacteria bacterium]
MSNFVHLHNHTHYSILDALTTPQELIDAAVKDGHPAIALTDHGVMYGVYEFSKYAESKGIKPIVGMEGYLANGSRFDKIATNKAEKRRNYFHILLLAKDEQGYNNLMKLSSLGYTEGFYYKPRIDKELLEKYKDGIICTSACMGSMVNAYIIDGMVEKAYSEAKYYRDLFGDDFYMEIQNHNLPNDPLILEHAPKIAKDLGIKLIASNDIHYLSKDFAIPHNILLLIRDGVKADGNTNIFDLKYGTPEFYFKTYEQMSQLFQNYPDALSNTLEIADKCNFKYEQKRVYPEFPIPQESKSETLDDYLRELVYKGLHERFDDISPEISERIEYELDVIIGMGFPGYFLIVANFIEAARKLKVSVGPGRGSAVGSLVAYALGITNVNPLPYNLLFERFLNPERFSMPDIDIDFSDEKRDLVINYVKEKYGENAVAQIITFGKLSSRLALTDVGRVLGISLSTVKEITKNIPVIRGKVAKIREAIELPDLKWLKDTNDNSLKELIDYAIKLEDRNRNVGTHAAGIVITPGDVTDYVPIYKTPDKEGKQSVEVATQFSMNYLEEIGLLKMDFLGLRTLSIIDHALEMIEENSKIKIDIDKIDFDDVKTYDMISAGDTLAVFQFESDGMQEYLKRLKPSNLEELTAMNALYRPGPMDNIPDFIERKNGRQNIEYLHPLMEKVLKTTYGIIVYQEQVMQLVQVIADFSLGQADILRRAMGKKQIAYMDKMKPLFVQGASQHNIDEKLALEIFDLIYKFADYGFNKSHSLAYSYLAFQTAWLKAHYPTEFLASVMTSLLNDQNQIVALIDEAKKFNIKVVPPDINKSTANFFGSGKTIFFGMAGIKNVGVAAVNKIVEARSNKPFTSIFDFIERVDAKVANRRLLEALICAGAFDSIHPQQRSKLFVSIDSILEYAKSLVEPETNMDSLFGAEISQQVRVEPVLAEIQEWEQLERLSKEKEYLNFYITGHPMQNYESIIRTINNSSIYKSATDGRVIRYCGMVASVSKRRDKKNNMIAFANIEEFNGKAECIFWSDAFEKYGHLLKEGELIIVSGTIQDNDDILKIVVNELIEIDDAINRFFTGYKIWINTDDEKAKEKIIRIHSKFVDDKYIPRKIRFFLINNERTSKKTYSTLHCNIQLDLFSIKQIGDIVGQSNLQMEIN